MNRASALAVLLSASAAGCSFAPSYNEPPRTMAAPDAYREAGDWKMAEPKDDVPRGEWWVVFGDTTLDELQNRVGGANQDLQAAMARLQQARAATRIQRAALFPNVTLGATASRGRASVNSPRFPAGAEPVGGNFDLEADLSYELDVWGRVRNAVKAAKAGQQASAADVAALDLSLRAELASDYFALRGHDAEIELLAQTVADYERALKLTENLYQGGAAAIADVDTARAQLATARTQDSEARLQRAQTEHAIAVLVGQNAAIFQIKALPMPLDVEPPAFDPGMPSALLERRPDVAAAERRVAAANFNLGVARAAYFPQFTLAAAAGFDSVHAASWLSAPSRLWSAGPSGMLTLFDAGRHRAQSDQARAAIDEQVADYRQVVLTAYQDVEDNLSAMRQLAQEADSQRLAVAATGRALEQSQHRYRAGLVTYLEVASNENAHLQAQITDVNIQVRRFSVSVLLVKALGGGWQQATPTG